MSEPTTPLDDGRNQLEMAAASAAMVGATTAAAALFPAPDTAARLVVVAVAVAGCAAALARARDALFVAGLGYLLFNGFLVNTQGELTWDEASLGQLLTLAAAIGAGRLYQRVRVAQAQAAVDAELRRLLDPTEPAGTDDPRWPPT